MPASITLLNYVEHWKTLIQSAIKKRTLARYVEILTLHILPRFGTVRVRDLNRGHIKLFLAEKRNTGLEKRTVQNIQSVLRAILNHAIEDQVIAANPAAKLAKALKLTVSNATKQEEIKAMTPEQRQLFLATASREAPRYYPLFFALAVRECDSAKAWRCNLETWTVSRRRSALPVPFQRMGRSARRNQATGARSISHRHSPRGWLPMI